MKRQSVSAFWGGSFRGRASKIFPMSTQVREQLVAPEKNVEAFAYSQKRRSKLCHMAYCAWPGASALSHLRM
jgi:hypothetical protein